MVNRDFKLIDAKGKNISLIGNPKFLYIINGN